MANYYDEQILGARQQAETARKLREMALQENPQGQMVSGHYVAPSWTQGLATGLRALAAAQKENAAEESVKDLQRQRAQATIQSMNQAGIQAPESLALQAGTPEQSPGFLSRASAFLRGEDQPQAIPAKAYQQNVAQNVPAEQRDTALMNMYTINPDIGAPLMQHEQWKLQQQQAKDLREQALADKKENREFLAEQRRQEQQARFDQQRKMANLTANLSAANRQAPQVYGVESINGVPMRVNKATGQVEPLDIPGMPKSAAKLTPEQQRVQDASDALDILKQAAPLIKKSTSSGLGAGVDYAAGLIGRSTEGADVASQLKVLGGALVSKMPKMSGPQSDKDVLLYKEMAGRIGDPTVPSSQKIAAMNSINELQAKYAGVEPTELQFDKKPVDQPSDWAIRPKGQ